jgi:Zn-dependent protease
MSGLLTALAGILKSGLLGKVLLSALTILLSVGSYALLYSWKFGLGLVALIFCHEMGHYLAARQKGLDVGLPMFIPFVGAFIALKEKPHSARVEAYVAYAGPFVGSLAAFAVYYWGRSTDSGFLLSLAQVGFLINLFNLIPLHPLDGGRITAVISPRIWLLGVPLLIAVWFYQPSSMLILIAIMSFPQLIKAWKYDPKAPENAAYYEADAGVRFEYAFLYLCLAVVLALMIQSLALKLKAL